MRRVAIMQPTYLPWLGYFDLMDQVDLFVLLDDVQFEKRSWQQRNRIKSSEGELILTLPVSSKGKSQQLINQVLLIDPSETVRKHSRTIELAYAKALYFKEHSNNLGKAYNSQPTKLIDLSIPLILLIRDVLGIRTEVILASDIESIGNKADKLVSMCEKLDCDEYISPKGSVGYLDDGQIFKDHGMNFRYHEYLHPVYRQLHGKFLPYMSVIDLLFNEGARSLEIIRSGSREKSD